MSGARGRHRRVDLQSASNSRGAPARTTGGGQAQELLRRFPPRSAAASWPGTRQPREQVVALVLAAPFAPRHSGGMSYRRRAVTGLVDWLSAQPGATWQQRWTASGADAWGNEGWRDPALSWLRAHGHDLPDAFYWHLGGAARALVCADVIRPSLAWLTTPTTVRCLAREMARTRDPDAFAELGALIDADEQRPAMKASLLTRQQVLCRIATIMAAKGGLVADITVGDCLELLNVIGTGAAGNRRRNSLHFYQVLHALGVFPPDAPTTVRKFYTQGQRSVEQLIDRYDLACAPVRDLLVDY